MPPDRPYTRDEVPYEPSRSASGSDSVPIVVPRPIVEERPLSLCEGDDDDHIASYDDVDPPSASTPTGVVPRTIMEERALSLCEGDDDHIASYDDVDPLPAIYIRR